MISDLTSSGHETEQISFKEFIGAGLVLRVQAVQERIRVCHCKLRLVRHSHESVYQLLHFLLRKLTLFGALNFRPSLLLAFCIRHGGLTENASIN